MILFSNKKYPITILTHSKQIVNSIFLIENPVFNLWSTNQLLVTFGTAFMRIRYYRLEIPPYTHELLTFNIFSNPNQK